MLLAQTLAATVAIASVTAQAISPAQPQPTLAPLGSFTALGGKVTGIDVSQDGRRLLTLGEFDDAVLWDVDGRELARASIPSAVNCRYSAVHPTQHKAVVVIDRFDKRQDGFALHYLAADRTGETVVQHMPPSPGIVLAVAWSLDGSLFALGKVDGSVSTVEIFVPSRAGLSHHESVVVPAVTQLVQSQNPRQPALRPFVGRWRWHRDELAGDMSLGRDVVDAVELKLADVLGAPRIRFDKATAADPEPEQGGLLVADANPRLARHIGGLGVGVDEIGQAFTRVGKTDVVRAYNAGPVLALAFTPDGRFVAAASRAAVTIAPSEGGATKVVPGKHLLSSGRDGDELLLLRANLRRYGAESGVFRDGPTLPAGELFGEGDPSVATTPQLRSFAALDDQNLAIGGFTRFGHDALLVDLEARVAKAPAVGHRDSSGLRIDVRQIEHTREQQYVTREYARATAGEMRRLSVLRGFDRGTQRWQREFSAYVIAIAPTPGGGEVLAADEDGGLSLLSGQNGTVQHQVRLPRKLHWLGFAGDRLLAHDGVDLVELDRTALTERHRQPLPQGAPITATALSADGRKLAFGRAQQVICYALTWAR